MIAGPVVAVVVLAGASFALWWWFRKRKVSEGYRAKRDSAEAAGREYLERSENLSPEVAAENTPSEARLFAARGRRRTVERSCLYRVDKLK